LRNILFIAATHSSTGEIDGDIVKAVFDLHAQGKVQPCQPHSLKEKAVDTAAAQPAAQAPAASLHDVEAQHIAELLERHAGSRRKVAQVLGISERTLYRKLKRYGLG
jgi:DNA-binding NtrC family response regulator